MQRTTRRVFLGSAATLAVAPAILRQARAAEITWRIGHTAPPNFPLHIRLVEAAELVGRLSDGRMEIQVLPDSQLGSQIGLLNQVRNGTLEMSSLTGQILTTAQGLAALPMTGFAFPGYPQVWAAMDGELGQTIRREIQLRTGIMLMERSWDFGFRIITTTDRPIRTPADLKGLRLRTPVEPEFVSLFQALQASPIAMSLNEVYPALLRRQLDGQEGLLALVPAARFQEVQKICSLTHHVWDGNWLAVSGNAWKALPEALKKVVAGAFDNAALQHRADTAALATTIQAAMTEAGMTFNTVDPVPFRDALRQAGYYRDLKKKLGDRYWEILEKYAGRLA